MSENRNVTLPHDHGEENIEELLSHIPEEGVIINVSAAMKQLGDPSRLSCRYDQPRSFSSFEAVKVCRSDCFKTRGQGDVL